MSASEDGKKQAKAMPDVGSKSAQDPQWASGLKQLYNSVVDEPLPDAFKDLLSKLDDGRAK